jgi:hypothetical protein
LGWSAATTQGTGNINSGLTLKALGMCGNNPYRVQTIVIVGFPRLSLRSNRWAGIGQRLRRKLQRLRYLTYNPRFLKGNKQCSND